MPAVTAAESAKCECNESGIISRVTRCVPVPATLLLFNSVTPAKSHAYRPSPLKAGGLNEAPLPSGLKVISALTRLLFSAPDFLALLYRLGLVKCQHMSVRRSSVGTDEPVFV